MSPVRNLVAFRKRLLLFATLVKLVESLTQGGAIPCKNCNFLPWNLSPGTSSSAEPEHRRRATPFRRNRSESTVKFYSASDSTSSLTHFALTSRLQQWHSRNRFLCVTNDWMEWSMLRARFERWKPDGSRISEKKIEESIRKHKKTQRSSFFENFWSKGVSHRVPAPTRRGQRRQDWPAGHHLPLGCVAPILNEIWFSKLRS